MMIGAGAILLTLGVGLGLWIGSIGRGKEMAKTAEVQAELDDYRRQVSEHFKTTAVHFESIGAEYRRLYEHMAAGAGSLCEMRPAIFETPIEKIAVQEIDEEAMAMPPRDYEEPVATEEKISESAPASAESLVLETAVEEPTDVELAETESREELLTDHDVAAEPVKNEKTLH